MAASTVPLHTRPGYVTLDAFYQMDDLPDWGAELADGVVVVTPPPATEHGVLARALYNAMYAHAMAHDLGEVFGDGFGYELPVPGRPDTYRTPDASFIRAGRFPRPWRRGRALALAPDLAIEVRSPSDTQKVLRCKLADYLDAGVALVWVVDDHRRAAAVYTQGSTPDAPDRVLGEGDALDGGAVLPGFVLPLARLFAELDG